MKQCSNSPSTSKPETSDFSEGRDGQMSCVLCQFAWSCGDTCDVLSVFLILQVTAFLLAKYHQGPVEASCQTFAGWIKMHWTTAAVPLKQASRRSGKEASDSFNPTAKTVSISFIQFQSTVSHVFSFFLIEVLARKRMLMLVN